MINKHVNAHTPRALGSALSLAQGLEEEDEDLTLFGFDLSAVFGVQATSTEDTGAVTVTANSVRSAVRRNLEGLTRIEMREVNGKIIGVKAQTDLQLEWTNLMVEVDDEDETSGFEFKLCEHATVVFQYFHSERNTISATISPTDQIVCVIDHKLTFDTSMVDPIFPVIPELSQPTIAAYIA